MGMSDGGGGGGGGGVEADQMIPNHPLTPLIVFNIFGGSYA